MQQNSPAHVPCCVGLTYWIDILNQLGLHMVHVLHSFFKGTGWFQAKHLPASCTCYSLHTPAYHHAAGFVQFLTQTLCLCRLCETYHTVSQLPLASPTFTHRLDPHWPLCTYDIRGSCRDAKCEFQHATDYQLENVAVLRDLHGQAVRSVSGCWHEAVACFVPCMHAIL